MLHWGDGECLPGMRLVVGLPQRCKRCGPSRAWQPHKPSRPWGCKLGELKKREFDVYRKIVVF